MPTSPMTLARSLGVERAAIFHVRRCRDVSPGYSAPVERDRLDIVSRARGWVACAAATPSPASLRSAPSPAVRSRCGRGATIAPAMVGEGSAAFQRVTISGEGELCRLRIPSGLLRSDKPLQLLSLGEAKDFACPIDRTRIAVQLSRILLSGQLPGKFERCFVPPASRLPCFWEWESAS
jgi:hypothetical protein